MPIDYVSGPNYFLTCPYGEDSPEELFEQIKKILDENIEDLRMKPWVANFVRYKPILDWETIESLAEYLAKYKIFKMAQYVPNNEYLVEQCRILDTHLEARGIPSRTFRTLKELHRWLNETV
jgi:hypothetical protein